MPNAHTPRSAGVLLATARGEEEGCVADPKSNQFVEDGWCVNVCAPNPEVDWCKGVCLCPEVKAEREDKKAKSHRSAPPRPQGDECVPDPTSNQKVNIEWCTSVCSPNPAVDYCKGVCVCPEAKPRAKPNEKTPGSKRKSERHESAPSKPQGDDCEPDPSTDQKVNIGWCNNVCKPKIRIFFPCRERLGGLHRW